MRRVETEFNSLEAKVSQFVSLCAVDLLVQTLGIAARRGELLAQLDVLRAQSLAKRDELRDLGLERIELRLHAPHTMLQNSSSVKQ